MTDDEIKAHRFARQQAADAREAQRIAEVMTDDEDRARRFFRCYEAFDPNGRGQATYPTADQLAGLERDLAAQFAAVRAEERKRRERATKGVEDGVSVAGVARGREATERVLRERDPGTASSAGGGAVRNARASAGDGRADEAGLGGDGSAGELRSVGDVPGRSALVGAEVTNPSAEATVAAPNAGPAKPDFRMRHMHCTQGHFGDGVGKVYKHGTQCEYPNEHTDQDAIAALRPSQADPAADEVPACPKCGRALAYIGKERWECKNGFCSFHRMHTGSYEHEKGCIAAPQDRWQCMPRGCKMLPTPADSSGTSVDVVLDKARALVDVIANMPMSKTPEPLYQAYRALREALAAVPSASGGGK